MKRIATPPPTPGILTRWAVILIAIGFMTGCALNYTAPVKPSLGGIYTDIKAPLTTDFNGNPATSNLSKASRKYTRFLLVPFIWGSFGWDDCAIAKIAREGGIREVSYADYEFLNVLGIYSEYTVNVYGNQ